MVFSSKSRSFKLVSRKLYDTYLNKIYTVNYSVHVCGRGLIRKVFGKLLEALWSQMDHSAMHFIIYQKRSCIFDATILQRYFIVEPRIRFCRDNCFSSGKKLHTLWRLSAMQLARFCSNKRVNIVGFLNAFAAPLVLLKPKVEAIT